MFHIDLKRDSEVLTISFKELNHSLGLKWAEALRDHIDMGAYVAQPHRIYNLNSKWTEQTIIDSINNCINQINTYENVIDISISSSMNQRLSNQLHHYFELLRGENENPNEFYDKAPKRIKRYIDEFNVLIHRWEDLGSAGRIVVHLKDRPTFDLEEEDFQYWTLDYQPGDIRLNYCHKGKTIYDVYKDGDTCVSDDNIRPQTKYSADFSIGFNKGPGITTNYNAWWNRMAPQLNSLGFYENDSKCAIGQAVIGKIIGDPLDIKKQIIGVTEIIGVRYD